MSTRNAMLIFIVRAVCTSMPFSAESSDGFTPPDNWPAGDEPIYYHGFEDLTDITAYNGAGLTTGLVSFDGVSLLPVSSDTNDNKTHF